MSTITLATGEGLRRLEIDGLKLGEALEEALGYAPEPSQVRVDGQEFIGPDSLDIDVVDGAVVQILSAAVATKGVSGA